MVESVTLSVRRWSAWAPGVYGAEAWHRWAVGEQKFEDDGEPDVGFVPPLLRRRLGVETRLAFRVAADCIDSKNLTSGYIFCSRYGEFTRTFGLLETLAQENPLSASAFSLSVHNTAASLFSIYCGYHGFSTSIAGGDATMEAAFVEAWSVLSAGEAETVLIVYFDVPLPDGYCQGHRCIESPFSVAVLVELLKVDSDLPRLSLGWEASSKYVETNGRLEGGRHDIVRLLLESGPPIETVTGRMKWKWSRDPK